MKKIILGLFLLGIIFPVCAANRLNVMTFNIRLDTNSDSLNAWTYRKDNVGNMLKYYQPDILGMQEVLHNQLVDLSNMLPGYDYVGVGRIDGKEEGEYCPLFFRKDCFELKQSGNFWLNENPNSIGVKGWDAACERITTWAILKDKKSKKEIVVFNTHFDHIGQVARRESSKLLLAKIAEIAGNRPVIVTGDFNGTPDSEPIRILVEGGLSDAHDVSLIKYGPGYSFHDFGRMPARKRTLIDYVFLKGNISVEKYRVIEDRNGGFLSDHNPVKINILVK